MKKILFLMVACFTIVACGSEEKKNDKKTEATEQEVEATKQEAKTVVQEAKEEEQKSAIDYFEAQMEVMEADDVEGFVAIAEEMAEWQNSQTEEEFAKQQQMAEVWFEKNGERYSNLFIQFSTKNMDALTEALENSNLEL